MKLISMGFGGRKNFWTDFKKKLVSLGVTDIRYMQEEKFFPLENISAMKIGVNHSHSYEKKIT